MMAEIITPNKTFVPDDSNTRLLRDAFGCFATGVTIVTAATDHGCVAITANSFSSVSLTPPLVLWSPDKNSRRFKYFEAAEHYAIHILAHDQAGLCFDVVKDLHALKNHNLSQNAEGVPILSGCLARFECTKKTIFDGGDHAIVLGQVNRAEFSEHGKPLTFFKGKISQFTEH